MKLTTITILLIIIHIGCTRNENFKYTVKDCSRFEGSIKHYDDLHNCYEQLGYIFPDRSAKSYILYENIADEYGEIYSQVGSGSEVLILERFRSLVSDSSMFKWGEAGTPWTKYKIDFIDSNNEIVNRIEVDLEGGMFWTTPDYGITKWGGLNDRGYKETKDLIQLIKN